MTGRTLTRYKLLEEVGQGGMAVVYKGLDTTLNREVAVKVLHPHLAGQAESRARLQREAHAVAKLRHENILEIFDYSGPDSPESYIVTEFIHGRTLKNFVVEHPLPFPEVAEMIASEIARALEHAHKFGVIHRDVKPENVMIRDDGMIKLMDFGIAQIVDKERMTVTGQLLGSPAYMAPEHVEGKPLDFRTDVFAVGIITYQLATGQLPFRGKNPHEVLKRIAECKFAPPEQHNPLVGKRLGRVIAKALAREPDARFADVAPMRKELLEDLADAGVDDARKELAAYFADPKGWARAYRPRLVEALAASGRKLAAAGRTAAALELWSRALAVEPKSVELRALVDGVARRQRRGRAAMTLAVLAVGGSASALGVRAYLHRPRPAAPIAITAPLVPVEKRPMRANGNVNVNVNANGNVNGNGNANANPVRHPRGPSLVRQLAALPVAPPRVVELVPTPKAVRVSLDGKLLGDFGPQLSRVELPPGAHTLTFESPFCYPKSVTVGASESPGRVAEHLRWKPATLTVTAQPPSADVLVDGKLVVHSGQPIPIAIDDQSLDGRREVAVKVSASGFVSEELRVKVRAAESKEQTVELKARGAE